MTRSLLLAALLFVLLAVPASADREGHGSHEDPTLTEREQVTNSLCPVSSDELVDPGVFTEYEGERVFFCCKRCRKQFIENPGAYTSNLPQFAGVGQVEPHDHERDHGLVAEISFGERAVRFAGKFHPLTVHFPIALLISALLAELLSATTRVRRFRDASRVFVLLGAPAAALAATLGWAAGLNARYPDELAQVLTTHRWLGTATVVLALVTLVASERYWRHEAARRHLPYLLALTLTAILVGITGHFGGTLIHGTEHFTW